jgi:O-antigen/teichoic acid export membrane protein
MVQRHSVVRRVLALPRKPATSTTITSLVILGSNALAGIVSARALGPAGRGQLAMVVLWSALISMVGSLGMLSSCSYHVACWPGRRSALAGWLRRIAAWQVAITTIISAAVLSWLHVRFGLAPVLTDEYTTWAGASVMTLYGTCYAQGLGNFGRFNLIRIIPGSAPAMLMLAIAVTGHLTTAEAGAAYLIPIWCSAVLACVWLRPANAGSPVRPLSRSERRSLWSYGWRSLGSFSGLTLNANGDQLALGILVPAGSLGLYSVAAAVSAPLTAMVASFGMVGLPTVAALAGRSKTRTTRRTIRRAIFVLVLVAPAVAALLPWAIPLVYGHHYIAAVMPAEILLLGAVFAALASVADDLLRAHGHPGFVCITQGLGGCVTIIGTVLAGGRSLAMVALISSSGFVITFLLALIRLRAVMRPVGLRAASLRTSSPYRNPAAPRRLQGPRVVKRADLESRVGRHRRAECPVGSGKHRRRARRDPSALNI